MKASLALKKKKKKFSYLIKKKKKNWYYGTNDNKEHLFIIKLMWLVTLWIVSTKEKKKENKRYSLSIKHPSTIVDLVIQLPNTGNSKSCCCCNKLFQSPSDLDLRKREIRHPWRACHSSAVTVELCWGL